MMRVGILFTALLLALCAKFQAGVNAQDTRAKEEAQYQSEPDPIQRAKLLGKLGHLEVSEARANLKAGDDEKSLGVLEHYRDEVRKTVDALSATEINAERHPAGFKELQISLRQTVRQVDDLIVMVPYDKRPWFQAVRADLLASQNSLISALFPSAGEKGRKRN